MRDWIPAYVLYALLIGSINLFAFCLRAGYFGYEGHDY